MDFNRRSNVSGFGGAGEQDRDPLMVFASRWWWLLAIGVVLGVSVAVAYAQYGPVTYSSTSLVQVQAQTENDPTAKADQSRSATSNFAAEASSTRIYSLVSAATAGEFTTAELSRMDRNGTLAIDAMRNANFITIEVTDSDPDRAQFLADTIATIVVDDVNVRSQEERDVRSAQLGDQIDFARQQLASAELFRRETEIDSQIRDQRGLLLSLQASYQQELSRQAESTSRSSEQNTIYTAYLEVVTAQIADVESTIESLNVKLGEVRTAISTLPAGSDAVLSGAYATAYSQQLAELTRQYVSQQLATVTASPPLTRYGDASNPFRSQSIKKLALFGVAIGGTVAAGLAYGLDLLRKRRGQVATAQGSVDGDAELERLLQRLNQYGAGQAAPAPVDRRRKRRNTAGSERGQAPASGD